ncbi:hypothetical protein PENCOP_c011G05322 [Penicillium coprophilum]|uniref:Uncharacterized protein n=1 Tax=Penicillium coprophilum TaxID=36646 RepID=A0A1V6UE28_9EURO|nr:hypothetical protein PENCOP_c011G05322 [Penicillium coprophilum]
MTSKVDGRAYPIVPSIRKGLNIVFGATAIGIGRITSPIPYFFVSLPHLFLAIAPHRCLHLMHAQDIPSPIESGLIDVRLQSIVSAPLRSIQVCIDSRLSITLKAPFKMANSRTLHLTSMWSLEGRGIPELRDKLKALNPGASMKVEYLRDKHILVVTGQFDEEYDLEITSLLAEYIEEHRNDDLLDVCLDAVLHPDYIVLIVLKMPRFRQLPTSAYFDPIPLPGSGSDAQPDVETLVEDIIPTQTTRDGRIVKFWYPSQADLGSISRDSGPLLSRISQMTETRITVQGTRGLRISAQSMDKINYAVNTLDSVEECLDLIENPNRGLIIFTPKRDNATFRIMPYEQISATALWRILIDRNAPLRLPNIMTLVVCEFDELANEFRPLRKLRQPPQVSLKEASITRDWEGYHVPEIGQRNDPLLGEIDQHLAPKCETPHEKIDAQHPYLSTGKAKDVSKWISRDFTKRPLATESYTKIPQEDDPSSLDFAAFGLAPEPGVSLSWRQRQLSQFKPKPPGVKGRVIMLPDGTIALPSQSPQEKPMDTPYGPNISVFSRLSYRKRVRHQQLAGSSVSASQEKRPAGTLRGATDSTAPSAASKQSGKRSEATGLAASIYSTSTQESESNTTPRLPLLSTPSGAIPKKLGETSDLADLTIFPANQQEKPSSALCSQTRSSSPIFNRAQPLGIPEVAESQGNTKLQGRSVDSVMGEIRLMLETANITRGTGREEAPSKPKITDQKQPRTISTQLDLSTGETDSLGPLIDLDCEVRTLDSGIQHIAAFEPLATAPLTVPGQSTDPEHDHFSHGDAPTFAETGDIFDIPNIDDTTKQPEITRGISPCPEITRDLMIPREATPNPAPSEPAQPGSAADMPLAGLGAAGSSDESDESEGERIHEHVSERRSKADEVAMEYLLQQIKDNPSPEVLSIEEIAVPLDATLSDTAPRGLSSDSRNCTSHHAVQQRHNPSQESEKVPFLHPDLIDISPQMLSPRLGASSGDSLQKSDSKNDEHDVEPVVDEKLAVSDEAQTREFHETMFHQRPSDKAFQWVDEITKAVKRPKIEVHTSNPLERGEDTEINKENKAKVKAPIVKLWQRRSGSESTKEQPRKGTVLPINAAVEIPKEKKLIYESTQSLFRFLEPILDAVRSFPGALSFQIQFGLMFMPSLPASTKEREMSYREVHQLFFSEHNLTPPPVSFFQRLTSSPADIDYLIDLEVNESRLFDQNYSHRGVNYEFWCRVGPNRTIIISVNELGDAMVRYPEFSLGSVHLSFPSQVWDAAARVQGFIEYITGADPELDEAARMMAKSIRVEPNNQNLRMLVRVPTESKIRIDQVFMERWSRHPYCSERSKDLFLQISETQELFGTPSVLDPEIKVFQNAPLEQMVKDGKQWWQASIVSSKVDEILKSNSFLEPGERNESWCATDLLGAEIMNIIPSTANEGLSTLGAEVGHSGIAAMFQLARTVAQKIDAVGYWNRGPASIEKRTNTSNERSRSGSGTIKESSSHLGKELVTWARPPKHRW